MAAQVDLVATSSTLAATHYVVLRTVRLNPPALPTPQGAPAGVSVISPTSRIGVTVVLANQGSSDEPHVSVRFSLADQTSGATTTQVRTTSLALGASVDAAHGDHAGQAVHHVPPHGPGRPARRARRSPAGTAIQQTLQVAPGT